MTPLHDIEPVDDLDWFDQADISLVFTIDITAPPDEVFDVLADHDKWPEWFSPVKSISNVGPASGIGARRRVEVPPLTVDEVFLVWEKPNRYTFTTSAINVRIVARMAEDWQLTETPTGSRVTNVVAADLPRWLRPFRLIVRLGMKRTTSSGVRELKHRVESNGVRR